MDNELQKLLNLPLVQMACQELTSKLPPTLVYHTFAHTEDVMREAYAFAVHDKLSPREVELLVIGAAYHDFGFIVRDSDNEILGADEAVKRAREVGGYTDTECESIRQMILDTKVIISLSGPRQVPSCVLGRYLCDADVSNLGREDFFEKVDQVRRELGVSDEQTFLAGVQKFLSSHQWHTPAARALRTAQKGRNMALLKERLKGE